MEERRWKVRRKNSKKMEDRRLRGKGRGGTRKILK
jgi:hypothetical protein